MTNAGKARYSTVVTADEFINADGSCGAGAPIPATPEPLPASGPGPEAEEPAGTVGQAPRSTASLPEAGAPLAPATLGVALGMSECEVARRAGRPERVEVGTDDRGERAVTLSYMRGERAGIYRFREGRLFTIERVQVAEPEKPKKPAKTAKPAAKKLPKQPSKQQAAKPAAPSGNAAPWPAPQAPQQQRAAQQSQVWPSPPPLRSANP